MNIAIQAVLLIAGVPLIVWLSTIFIGLITPIHITAPRMLKKQLRSLRVAGAISDDCIREFADRRIKLAQATRRIDRTWRLTMVKGLDLDAELIAGWVRLGYDFDRAELQWHKEILQRHGIRRLGNKDDDNRALP